MHSHRVNACDIDIIINQSVDPVIMHRNIRCAISPVMQDPGPADLPHKPCKQHEKREVHIVLPQQPPDIPSHHPQKHLELPPAVPYKALEAQLPQKVMSALSEKGFHIRNQRDLVELDAQ